MNVRNTSRPPFILHPLKSQWTNIYIKKLQEPPQMYYIIAREAWSRTYCISFTVFLQECLSYCRKWINVSISGLRIWHVGVGQLISDCENICSDVIHVGIYWIYILHAVYMTWVTHGTCISWKIYLDTPLSGSQKPMISRVIQLLNSSFSLGDWNDSKAQGMFFFNNNIYLYFQFFNWISCIQLKHTWLDWIQITT